MGALNVAHHLPHASRSIPQTDGLVPTKF